ncbi:hypothetical protein IC582_014209 [Cucumis melo]
MQWCCIRLNILQTYSRGNNKLFFVRKKIQSLQSNMQRGHLTSHSSFLTKRFHLVRSRIKQKISTFRGDSFVSFFFFSNF